MVQVQYQLLISVEYMKTKFSPIADAIRSVVGSGVKIYSDPRKNGRRYKVQNSRILFDNRLQLSIDIRNIAVVNGLFLCPNYDCLSDTIIVTVKSK